MMDFMKGTTLLLLLVVAALGANADDDHCGGLNKTILGADLHKVEGDWVLVWSVSDSQLIAVANLSNSHVQTHLSSDKSTLFVMERNRFRDSSCTSYNASLSVVSDHHKLNLIGMYEEKGGVVADFNETATMYFFETCSDCAAMFYHGKYGQFLLIYRREGHHQDLKKIEESHDEFKKLAGCLGIPLEGAFIYEGDENFCHKPTSS